MMTHCPDIERELAAFCSGELDPALREDVRVHLDDCASCREELARERTLRHTLGTLPEAGAPTGLEAGILAALDRDRAETPNRNFGRRLTVAASLAAAALAAALLMPSSHPGTDRNSGFSDQEIAAARQEVMYTLELTARVLDQTQKTAVIEVFADKLPKAINESFKTMKPNTPGGNG